jgi:CheY-specific phosphatase CheX
VEFKNEEITEIVTDIWTAMLGFPIESRSEPAGPGNEATTISARVTITGEWDGWVVVNCPETLSREVATAMLQDGDDDLTLGTVFDALGEVKNLIQGLCRLTPPQVTDETDLSVPDADSAKVFEASFDCGAEAFTVSILEAA